MIWVESIPMSSSLTLGGKLDHTGNDGSEAAVKISEFLVFQNDWHYRIKEKWKDILLINGDLLVTWIIPIHITVRYHLSTIPFPRSI